MKKTFTSVLFLLFLFAANAQTFFTANFSGGISNWTLQDNSGNGAGNWQYVHNPVATVYYGNLSFKSATNSNGFALFKSEMATDDGKPEDADLISPAINCSAYSYIHLELDEWFVQRSASEGSIYVSTDNVNWTLVYSINYTEGTATHKQLDLTTWAANQPTVYLKFNFVGNNDFFWAIDDIKLVGVPMLDVAVDTVSLNQYVPAGNTTITGRISNPGGVAINSVEMTYTINGGSATSESFYGLSIPPFGTYDFAFPVQAQLDSFMKYTIAINAFGPNGGSDNAMGNNTSTKDVYALSAIPARNIMLEEFTTAACQYCPMGGTVVENISHEFNDVIPVALHAGFGTDAMTTSDHSTINSSLGNGSAPALMIDRVYWNDAQDVAVGLIRSTQDFSDNLWRDKTIERRGEKSPLSIKASSSYNSTNRQLTVVVTTKFYTKMSGLALRPNCYIVEDSVTGSGSGYNQVNYYTNHDNGSYNPWYGKGSPIVGFKHRHVGRYLYGGAWGEAGVIPANVNAGDEYTTQYSYTLPATWNINRIKLVAFVQDYHNSTRQRSIINSLEYAVNEEDSNTVSEIIISGLPANTETALSHISLYPNPAINAITLDYDLGQPANVSFEVNNILGQRVYSVAQQQLGAGAYRTKINTATYQPGIYFVTVKNGNQLMQTLKFIVAGK